jgi:hypothetical protein
MDGKMDMRSLYDSLKSFGGIARTNRHMVNFLKRNSCSNSSTSAHLTLTSRVMCIISRSRWNLSYIVSELKASHPRQTHLGLTSVQNKSNLRPFVYFPNCANSATLMWVSVASFVIKCLWEHSETRFLNLFLTSDRILTAQRSFLHLHQSQTRHSKNNHIPPLSEALAPAPDISFSSKAKYFVVIVKNSVLNSLAESSFLEEIWEPS